MSSGLYMSYYGNTPLYFNDFNDFKKYRLQNEIAYRDCIFYPIKNNKIDSKNPIRVFNNPEIKKPFSSNYLSKRDYYSTEPIQFNTIDEYDLDENDFEWNEINIEPNELDDIYHQDYEFNEYLV